MIDKIITKLMNERCSIDGDSVVLVSDEELSWDCPDGMCGSVILATRDYVYRISKDNIKDATTYKDGSIWLRADVSTTVSNDTEPYTGNDMECLITFEEI